MEQSELHRYSGVEMADLIERLYWWFHRFPEMDYGTDMMFTSREVHLLSFLATNPGSTVTQLAEVSRKTKGAISQMLHKLESRGLVYREKDVKNSSKYHLYLTEKGKEVDRAHCRYDEESMNVWVSQARDLCTEMETQFALNVIERWLIAAARAEHVTWVPPRREKENSNAE